MRLSFTKVVNTVYRLHATAKSCASSLTDQAWDFYSQKWGFESFLAHQLFFTILEVVSKKKFKVTIHKEKNPPKQSFWVDDKEEFLAHLSEILEAISDEELTSITKIIVFTRLKN